MAEVQLSFFDAEIFDAEAAREYRRKQHRAELEALFIQYAGEEEARKWHEKVNKRKAKLEAFMAGYQLSPRMQAAADGARAKILATMKPFLSDEYSLLGIAPGATKRDIKNAYRRQARRLHPDTGGDEEAFKRMYAAYRKLLMLVKD